ncbi:MAG: hypothetical protein JW839_13870 [Candidatus Lokiarchaeota archaeon]|nr:hypothetical protein [Candidatus Lokiarchaeota archaeon]
MDGEKAETGMAGTSPPAWRARLSLKLKRKEGHKKEDLWNRVGFHRITGAYLFGYILALGEAILGLVLVGAILPVFLPYPEITGYKNAAAAFVGFWYGLFDLNLGGGGGFSDGMMRFIGQYSSNDPRRAIKYIQFYLWFQMFTGLVQITMFSLIGFVYLVHTNVAYLVWFIIADMMVQYPGMLMIMSASLKAFQRGDKLGILVWLQNTIFQGSVNLVCLVAGKAWGASDPRVGELMGIVVFYILSMYVDDWINLALGSHFFNQVLKERGITEGVRAVFRPNFDRAVIRQCLSFTGKQWIGNQVLGAFGYLVGLYIIVNMPSFAAWSGMLMIPAFLGHLVSHQSAMVGLASPAISEAYNNGKMEYTNHVLKSVLKWYCIVTFYMFTSMVIISPRVIMTVIDAFPALKNYQLGIVMIPVVLVVDMTGPLRGFWSTIFVASNRPMPPIYLNFIFTLPGYALKFLFIWLCLDVGVLPVWTLLMVPDGINGVLQAIAGYIWIQKRVIKVQYRKMLYQGVIAPVLACACYAAVLVVFSYTAWPVLEASLALAIGETASKIATALIVLLSMIFIFPGIFFCPFLALLGCWDDYTLEELRKSVELSGPSRFAMRWMFKITAYFAGKCKWRNSRPISDYDRVEQEMHDLVAGE